MLGSSRSSCIPPCTWVMFWSSSPVLNVVGAGVSFNIFCNFLWIFLWQISVFTNITDVGVTQAYRSIPVAEQGVFLGTGDSLFDSVKISWFYSPLLRLRQLVWCKAGCKQLLKTGPMHRWFSPLSLQAHVCEVMFLFPLICAGLSVVWLRAEQLMKNIFGRGL